MSIAAPELKTGMRTAGAGRSIPGKSQTIIRFNPSCKLLPQLSADAFRDIPGVHEVHVDAAHKTIRIVFDGMKETVGHLADYLCSCEQKSRCGANAPCGEPELNFDFE